MNDTIKQLMEAATSFGDNPLADTLVFSGSAAFDDWRNHVPALVVQLWRTLGPEAKLCAYLTAKSFTAYDPKTFKESPLVVVK